MFSSIKRNPIEFCKLLNASEIAIVILTFSPENESNGNSSPSALITVIHNPSLIPSSSAFVCWVSNLILKSDNCPKSSLIRSSS